MAFTIYYGLQIVVFPFNIQEKFQNLLFFIYKIRYVWPVERPGEKSVSQLHSLETQPVESILFGLTSLKNILILHFFVTNPLLIKLILTELGPLI
jgi:hypothetical protein